MNKEMLIQQVSDALQKMGCTDIKTEDKDNRIIVLFNCKEIVSFTLILPGWQYSGIQLDTTKQREYKIEFSQAVA